MDSSIMVPVRPGWTEVTRPKRVKGDTSALLDFFNKHCTGKFKDCGPGGGNIQFELAEDAWLFKLKFGS